MKPARILDVPEWLYHRDPCDTPSLSSSLAHVLATESPAHAWDVHPKFGAAARTPTRAQDKGTLTHLLLLGKGCELAIIDADDFKTKAARDQRDAARAEHKLPVLRHQLDEAEEVAMFLRARFDELGIALTGQSEVPITWTESGAFGNVECRALLDHLELERVRGTGALLSGTITDIKTITTANPEFCEKRVYEFGYDIQERAYTRAVEALYPELMGRVRFRFIFCELEPPFAVTPAELAGSMRKIGELRWERALSLFARCTRENHWPTYTNGVVRLEAPAWAIKKELGELGEVA